MSQPETVQRWEERLRRFEQSQTTVAQFCADEGCSQPAYYYWRRKLRGPAINALRKPSVEIPRFLPVALAARADTPSPATDPTADAPHACATIELPGGVRIHVQVPAQRHDNKLTQSHSPEVRS